MYVEVELTSHQNKINLVQILNLNLKISLFTNKTKFFFLLINLFNIVIILMMHIKHTIHNFLKSN